MSLSRGAFAEGRVPRPQEGKNEGLRQGFNDGDRRTQTKGRLLVGYRNGEHLRMATPLPYRGNLLIGPALRAGPQEDIAETVGSPAAPGSTFSSNRLASRMGSLVALPGR